MTDGYYYLASPYTHVDPAVLGARARKARGAVAWLLQQNFFVYSPIAHLHQVGMDHGLPIEYEFWHGFNTVMIKQSCGLIVLRIDGWEVSRGIAAELDVAKLVGRKVLNLYENEEGFILR